MKKKKMSERRSLLLQDNKSLASLSKAEEEAEGEMKMKIERAVRNGMNMMTETAIIIIKDLMMMMKMMMMKGMKGMKGIIHLRRRI
jgi:hypothetical protein